MARQGTDELRALQQRQLVRFLREELLPFSVHYRRLFDQAGVDAREIRRVEDLARLPFTTKQDLLAAQADPERKLDFLLRPSPQSIKASWPFGRKLALVLGGARGRAALRRAYTPNVLTFTTGRSTEPVGVAYTPHDVDVLAEAIARMFQLMDVVSDTERIANLFPFAPHLAFWAVTFGGLRTGRLVVPSGGGKVMGTEGNLKLVERIRATALIGTPGFLYHMLRRGNELGTRFEHVRTVVLGAEKVPPGMKRKMLECLERGGAKGVRVLGTYGFTEARMAFGECPTGIEDSSGYHYYPDMGVFEVIDPATGKNVGDDQDGELVYTGISGHGTCVVRYRTGDLVVGGITWRPCPHCGRNLPRIASELRRVSEQHALNLTKVRGTLVDLAQIGTLLAGLREVEEWQIVLKKRNDDPLELDEFEIRLAARSGVTADELKRMVGELVAQASEVKPNRVTVLPLAELLDQLGMETQLKEKRILDLRPK
jgi:phenylacetate-coenzyme A ligase PaaK-like adenylate-forming protein